MCCDTVSALHIIVLSLLVCVFSPLLGAAVSAALDLGQ